MPRLPGNSIICFDLGGVLARICTHWQQAARHAGVLLGTTEDSMMSDCPVFDAYQHGQIDEDTYLAGLAEYLGLSNNEQARRVHLAILIEPYPGTYELVADLKARGFATGCLSNTNAPHWQTMAHGIQFPAISSLDFKVASHEIQLHKPDPAMYKRFEEVSGYKTDQVVFFDDGFRNVESALMHGWEAYQIDPTGSPAQQMSHALEI